MQRLPRILLLLASPLPLSACGARGDLTLVQPSPPQETTSDDAGAIAIASDACPPTPIALTHSETFPTGSLLRVDSIAPDGDGILLVTSALGLADGTPNPDPAWRVRRVNRNLTLGPPGASLAGDIEDPAYLAVGFDHRAFLASDFESGCRFVPLDADGAATSPPVLLGQSACDSLLATPDGFVLFEEATSLDAPAAMVTLDPSGSVVSHVAIDPGAPFPTAAGLWGDLTPRSRAVRFDDGTLFVAWTVESTTSTAQQIVGRHLSAAGEPLAPLETIFDASGSGGVSVFAMTPLGSTAIAGWGDDLFAGLTVAATNEDGVPGAATRLPRGPTDDGSDDLDLVPRGTGALAAWSEPRQDASDTWQVVLQPLDARATAVGARHVLSSDGTAWRLRLAATASDVFVAYTGPPVKRRSFVTEDVYVRRVCGL